MEIDNERANPAVFPTQRPGTGTGVVSLDAIVDAWALNVDLEKIATGLAHVSINEKRIEQIVAFSRSVFLEGLNRRVLVTEPKEMTTALVNTFEGFADTLLAPRAIIRDRFGFVSHPAIPACDEDVRIDRLLSAFGLETKFIDLDSDLLAADAKDRMYEAFNFTDWTPSPPDGDGWILLEIQETENGVYALFARRALRHLQRLHGTATVTHSHRPHGA
jgi:hypothetical protein